MFQPGSIKDGWCKNLQGDAVNVQASQIRADRALFCCIKIQNVLLIFGYKWDGTSDNMHVIFCILRSWNGRF